MPFSAQAFNVLIASPADVPKEREAIASILHDWNALNSQATGYILLPVMWESHSAPAMGDRPQGIINTQVVRSCDMLIGAFWNRLGSPTGVEDSGTVEEVKYFLRNNKPVMLYYSRAPVDAETIDTTQLEKLKAFKQSIRDKGIQEQYATIEELKQKLSRHLTIVMRGMSVDTKVNAEVVQEARKASNASALKSPTPGLTSERTTATEDEKVRLQEYSERSFVVLGNTLRWKDELKGLGGKWMRIKDGRMAWNFSKKRSNEVARVLGIDADIIPLTD